MSTIKQLADEINTANNSYDIDLVDKLTDIYFEIQNHRELMNKQSPVYDESVDGSYIEDMKENLIELFPCVITDYMVELVNDIYSIDLNEIAKVTQALKRLKRYGHSNDEFYHFDISELNKYNIKDELPSFEDAKESLNYCGFVGDDELEGEYYVACETILSYFYLNVDEFISAK